MLHPWPPTARLAAARLCDGHQVAAAEGHGPGLGLDGRGRLEACLLDLCGKVGWGGRCLCVCMGSLRTHAGVCMHACMHARTCARTCGMHARVRLHAQHTGRCCMLHTACKSLSVCRESTRRWRRAQPRVEPPAAAAVCLRCGMPHLLLLLRAHSALRMHKPHDAHMLPMLLRLHPPC